uniref:Uncharacterized protein n=1 Tax=Eutreptiella gymnastica TaxID=73025 RepID=A0A7S4CVQ7_9EUGL
MPKPSKTLLKRVLVLLEFPALNTSTSILTCPGMGKAGAYWPYIEIYIHKCSETKLIPSAVSKQTPGYYLSKTGGWGPQPFFTHPFPAPTQETPEDRPLRFCELQDSRLQPLIVAVYKTTTALTHAPTPPLAQQ